MIAVASGKGGVGTTTVAVNLSVAFAQRRLRTVLVDADGGDARILCRLDERHTLADVLAGRRAVREALQPGPGGIHVLPGAWGLREVTDCSAESQQRLIGQLMDLGNRTDLVVVDAGNGSSRLVKRFWQAADQVLLLTTPDLTAVMDAYASVKVLAAGNDSISIRPVVNMVNSLLDVGDVYSRLARACLRFLGLRLPKAAAISANPRVAAGGESQQPFVLAEPAGQASLEIRRLVDELSVALKLPVPWSPRDDAAWGAKECSLEALRE
jgi:flagellar biosynthesis protein FlhG